MNKMFQTKLYLNKNNSKYMIYLHNKGRTIYYSGIGKQHLTIFCVFGPVKVVLILSWYKT